MGGVRPGDLQEALLRHRPDVVHFSGHGEANAILLQGDDGQARRVPGEALAQMFQTHKDRVRLVVFNACYSGEQARAVAEHIDFAIGMRDAIGDEASVAFAAELYMAIGYGCSMQKAFDTGMNALALHDLPEHDQPALHCREGADAARVVLVDANAPSRPLTDGQPVHRGDVVAGDKVVHGDDVQGDKHVHNIYTGPAERDRRRQLIAAGVGLIAIAVVAVVLSSPAVTRGLCRVPGIRAVCGAVGAGGVAGTEEMQAWCAALAALPSPQGLHDYRQRYPDGAYIDEAESRLEHDCRTVEDTRWVAETISLPLFVGQGVEAFDTRAEAERDALRRGADEARAVTCTTLRDDSMGRYQLDGATATARDEAWTCTDEHGWKCSFEGQALCAVQKRDIVSSIHCNGRTTHDDCQ